MFKIDYTRRYHEEENGEGSSGEGESYTKEQFTELQT